MLVDLAELQTEILTDPTLRGYSQTDNAFTAGLLNELQASIQIERELVPTWAIVEATVQSDYTALSAGEKSRYGVYTGLGELDLRGPNIRAGFTQMFPGGSTTRDNLIALLTRDGSRAEELWGTGASVRSRDVNEALNL